MFNPPIPVTDHTDWVVKLHSVLYEPSAHYLGRYFVYMGLGFSTELRYDLWRTKIKVLIYPLSNAVESSYQHFAGLGNSFALQHYGFEHEVPNQLTNANYHSLLDQYVEDLIAELTLPKAELMQTIKRLMHKFLYAQPRRALCRTY